MPHAKLMHLIGCVSSSEGPGHHSESGDESSAEAEGDEDEQKQGVLGAERVTGHCTLKVHPIG